MTSLTPGRPRVIRNLLRNLPRNRFRPRRLTLRARLTLVYGVLFLAAGVVLLGTTYALFNQQLTSGGSGLSTHSEGQGQGEGTNAPPPPDKSDSGPTTSSFEDQERQRLNDAAATTFVTQGGIALGIVGAAAGGLGWLVAGRVLTPLHRVTDTAARIAAAPVADRGLHERIALTGPDDEVKDLADTFDTMIERLGRSFDDQRRFVANASHELRTPLTIGRALVEMAMHRKTASDDVKQVGEQLLDINARHERLISGLLLLADAESHIPEPTPVDLAEVVSHVVAISAEEAGKAGIAVYAEPGTAPTVGDPQLLESMVKNLVDNGIRHNTTDVGGWVRVVSRSRDDHVEIEVSNTGPDVPAYEIPSLFQPFRRLGTERLVTAKGSGLGLSIVRAIARAHRGNVTAHPNKTGGLTVTVTLSRHDEGQG
ncbi:cell wall metabolism sensor histidine kinase WalK [Streptomyces sp. AC512_CC834]|uniref:sensor histidine kinase n=1 Tax=Streptomyces sp. AC512_CC834 TaxID=2823691 RepID=UPI001C259F5B|nr:HAMP domain-containing sensor histidine kinase [Streptomyces sp. AC512_CC834]